MGDLFDDRSSVESGPKTNIQLLTHHRLVYGGVEFVSLFCRCLSDRQTDKSTRGDDCF